MDGVRSPVYALRVPQPLPRAFRRQLAAEDAEKLDRIVRDAESFVGATSGGSWQRLRGVPAIGKGCSSTSPGTDPVRALLAKESRRR